MRFQAERAHRTYDEALALLPDADRAAQKPGLMMASIYRTLLREIEGDDFQVLHQRISLTPLRKLWLAMRTQLARALTLAGRRSASRSSAPAGPAWPPPSRPRARGHARHAVREAPQLGGRARDVVGRDGAALDNGQHILIGAYRETLRLMRDRRRRPGRRCSRMPLTLRFADGGGLRLPRRRAARLPRLGRRSAARGWTWRDKALAAARRAALAARGLSLRRPRRPSRRCAAGCRRRARD